MREIKFRAWKDGQMFLSPSTLEALHHLGSWFEAHSAFSYTAKETKDSIIMQFTGFNHNGVDIFESDILEFELEDGGTEIGVVRFSKEGYWTSQKESEHEEILSEELDYYKDKVKLIGDIYSTPNLVP